MKKKIKLIVPSFLTLVFCLLLIAGSTYAIFSSQDDASIEVKSGKVDLKATISNLEAFSAEAVDSLGANDLDAGIVPANKLGAGQYRYKALVGTNENTLYTFTTGGTASLNTTTGALSLNKIVAGDRVTMKLNLTNYSNVDIKYRVRVNLESGLELFNELVIKINGVKLYGVSKTGTWTYLEAGLNPESLDIPIEVYLPITNENMNSRFTTNENGFGTKIKFVVEAVQGNAKTVDEVLSNSVEATKQVATPSAEQVVSDDDQLVTVTVPAGALDNTTTALSVQVEPQDTVGNITISSEQAALSYDVKVLVTKSTSTESEVYESTTNKVKVNMFVGTGLKGVKLYHTHNDVTTEITDFDYDEETGYIEFETLKFSEYTVLYNKDLVIETVVNNVSTITTYKATEASGVYTKEDGSSISVETNESGEQIYIENKEARIGSVYYDTLNEALGAAVSGDIVELLCDIECSEFGDRETCLCSSARKPYYFNRLNANITLEGNNHTIKMMAEEKSYFISVLFGTIQNVKFTNINTSLIGDLVSDATFKNVKVYGEMRVSGNTGAFATYMWRGTAEAIISFINCDAYVNIYGTGTATDYNAVFAGYIGSPSLNIYFTNCNYYGEMICGRAAFFVGNPVSTSSLFISNCHNYGKIYRTFKNDPNDPVLPNSDQFIFGVTSTHSINTSTFDGVEFTMNDVKNGSLDSNLGGTIVLGNNTSLNLVDGEHNNYSVVTMENASYYVINYGLYVGTGSGSARYYITETIGATGGESGIEKLNFVDSEWVEQHQDAVASHPSWNTSVTIYTIEEQGVMKSYYYVNNSNYTLHGNVSGMEMISVSAFDADGRLLGSAGLNEEK